LTIQNWPELQDEGCMKPQGGAGDTGQVPGHGRDAQPVHRGWVFTIVALPLFMMAVDGTIVATVLHTLQQGLRTSVNWAGWTLTAYSFGFVLMLPVSGKLSERYGRRKVFLGSVVTFTVASLCCGLAENIFVLIGLRAIQAAGGAGFTPSATGIIVDHFGDARDRAVSLFGSIFPIGSMVGPIFGGLFVTYWTWRGVFFVNVPIGIVVIALAMRHVPPDSPRPAKARFGMDVPGMAWLGICLLAGMFAISYLGERDVRLGSPVFLVPAAIAIVSAWSFFHHVRRSPSPFISPRFIHGPGFGPVNLVNLIYSGITIGAVALIPLYATNRYGVDALDSGTLLIAQGAAAIMMSLTGAMILRRTGHRLPIYAGGVVIAGGMLLLAVGPHFGISPYVWLACAAFLVGAGGGMLNPASRNAGLQLAPQQSSTLAALRSLSLQIGAISTISITTAALTASSDPGRVQAWVYVASALLLVAALPLVARVPEHRGAW
jgi:MFS family permease